MSTQRYFDYAAATPMDDSVAIAMQPYFSALFYNPSATYLPAQSVKKDLEAARATIGSIIGAQKSEIVFTAGGTEANNLAIQGVLRQFPDGNVVISSIEHESVIRPAELFSNQQVSVLPSGIIDTNALLAVINDQTVLVSVMFANNEVGTVQPIRAIAQELETIRRKRQQAGNKLPLYFHTDAAQAAAYLDIHVSRLGVDLMTINGGKIYGPKQSGLLFVSSGVKMQPLIFGGGQERGMRSGTENVAGAVGLATALQLVQERRHDESLRLRQFQGLFLELLKKQLPEAVVNGSLQQRLPNNVHFTVPGKDNERMLLELEEQGILAAAGSACSASDEEPSHVLRAMGIQDAAAQASLRFSMGYQTTEDDVREVVNLLEQLTSRQA
jgi:cysteine desulfurase